ncbi:MAG: hypothetical protein E6I08_16715 [Chloroflexi bacterium]|nr:MAG: hypothetical protein E6I08_16715 [Chloroflexota bacterium]
MGLGATEFRVLGPVQALAEGRVLPLGGPKQRALLAELLLHGGAVLPRDHLVDALWDDPPTSARASLQVYVHGLRRAIGTERIETHGDGYRIQLEPAELDLARFERLVGKAERALSEERVADASDDLDAALALWAGPPLADLADQPRGPCGDPAPRGAAAPRTGASERRPARARRPRLPAPGARAADRRPAVPRTAARAADSRAVPRGAAEGRAGGVPARTARARRGARGRARACASGARARDPAPRRRSRGAGEVAARTPGPAAGSRDLAHRASARDRRRRSAAATRRRAARDVDRTGGNRQDAPRTRRRRGARARSARRGRLRGPLGGRRARARVPDDRARARVVGERRGDRSRPPRPPA